jgi:cyclophilin family peptidyl-prolyl cis-trans isomerase
MRKKGTVCAINYIAYNAAHSPTEQDEESSWSLCAKPADLSGLEEIDRRFNFKFSIGAGDIDQSLEHSIPQSGAVWIKRGQIFCSIEVIEGPIEMSTDEIFGELLKLKSLGNDALKDGQVSSALALYNEAIELMVSPHFNRRTPTDLSQVFTPLYLNKALCCLKLGLWREAIDSCCQVLEVDSNNVKALYRRGVARFENQEIGNSKRDLLSAAHIEPGNVEVRQKLREVSLAERVGDRQNSLYNKLACPNSPRTNFCIDFVFPNNSVDSVKITLFDDIVPKTADNFKRLIPKYIGSRIFKIVKSQICQMGDYEFNDGSGGNCQVDPDTLVRGRRFFNDERLDGFHDRKALIGMANYGPNTNASQFYITFDACPHLDGKHVIFGEVIENLACLDKINSYASESDFHTSPTGQISITNIQLV